MSRIDAKAKQDSRLIFRVEMDEELERGQRQVLGRVHESCSRSIPAPTVERAPSPSNATPGSLVAVIRHATSGI